MGSSKRSDAVRSDPDLGHLSDRLLALRHGITPQRVGQIRKSMGIPVKPIRRQEPVPGRLLELTIRLDPKDLTEIKLLAEEEGVSVGSWVRSAVSIRLARVVPDRVLTLPDADIDRMLREEGGDPAAIGERGRKAMVELFRRRKACPERGNCEAPACLTCEEAP